MTGLTPGVRRLCVAVDVAGYSRLSTPDQIQIQRQLLDLVRGGSAAAGTPFRQEFRQDSGDGVLLVLPPGINEPQVVPAMVNSWRERLEQINRTPAPWGRMRLRAAIGQGIVHNADTGYAGDAVITACRLLDSAELRAALAGNPDRDLALIVPDDLFRDLVAQDYPGLPARDFRAVRVVMETKGFEADAWISVPGPPPHAGGHATSSSSSSSPVPGREPRFTGDLDTAATTLSALASVVGIASTIADWSGKHHHDPAHPEGADQDPAHHEPAHDPGHHDPGTHEAAYEHDTTYEDGVAHDHYVAYEHDTPGWTDDGTHHHSA